MGGAGALGTLALRQWAGLCAAGAVPPVRQHQAGWRAAPEWSDADPRRAAAAGGALRSQLIRIVVVRDPSGRRREEAFFCTDLAQDPASILQTYAHRWTLEVTFHDSKQHLGSVRPRTRHLRRSNVPPLSLDWSTA